MSFVRPVGKFTFGFKGSNNNLLCQYPKRVIQSKGFKWFQVVSYMGNVWWEIIQGKQSWMEEKCLGQECFVIDCWCIDVSSANLQVIISDRIENEPCH